MKIKFSHEPQRAPKQAEQDSRIAFSKRVIALICAIPQGQVATYGLIAKLAGNPRGARAVGWLLHSSTQKYNLPWQRVIKSDGSLPFPEHSPNYLVQKSALEAEGIMFLKNGRVNLKQTLWESELLYERL